MKIVHQGVSGTEWRETPQNPRQSSHGQFWTCFASIWGMHILRRVGMKVNAGVASNITIFKIAPPEDDHQETCAPQVVVHMKVIIMKYFKGPRLGQSQFLCDIACSSPLLSFHSCNYSISISCFHTIVGNLHSYVPQVSHFLLWTHCSSCQINQHPDYVDQTNIECIPVHQYQLDSYRYWRVRACGSIRCIS